MLRAKKSYWVLKYDAVTMRLPFPFLKNFPVRHKEYGEGRVMEVFYDRGCYFVGFSNEKEHEKELSCKVNELFDLSGMWVVDFDTLARKSEAYKASYENDRRELSNKMSNLRHANKHWARMYGVEELDRLIDEVEKGGLLFIR